jgi:hypothetical protein
VMYLLKCLVLVILCVVFVFTAFSAPWYMASNSQQGVVLVLISLGALAGIGYIIYSLRRSVIKTAGNPKAFNMSWAGAAVGAICAIIKWKVDLAGYIQQRGVHEIYNSDIAGLLMLIILFGVVGFIGGLFVELIRNKVVMGKG